MNKNAWITIIIFAALLPMISWAGLLILSNQGIAVRNFYEILFSSALLSVIFLSVFAVIITRRYAYKPLSPILAETINEALVILDNDYKILYLNETAQDLFVSFGREFIGLPFEQLIANDYALELKERLFLALESNYDSKIILESNLKNSMGKITPVTIAASNATKANTGFNGIILAIIKHENIPQNAGDSADAQHQELEKVQTMLMNTLRDLNIEKEILEQEKAKDEALLKAIGDGVIAANKNGEVIFINQTGQQMLGWTDSEAKNKKLNDLLRIEDGNGQALAADKIPLNMALANKQKYEFGIASDFYSVRRNNTKFPIAISANPVLLKGSIIGAIIVLRDITHEKIVDQAKSEFVSLASHQLRTPLSTIKWYVEMLLEGDAGKFEDVQTKYLKVIYKSNQRMIELVNDLLNVSRIELGTFAVEPQQINIQEVIEGVLEELFPQIDVKKIEVEKYLDPNFPSVNADPKLIRIIAQNLITNAITYTPPEGSIRVAININESNNNFIFSVADTGYGIPKNDQSKVFTKLFRADNVRERVTEGTGLGLYIVKSIVEQSGGKIWFESEENQGTIFYVSLPMTGMQPKQGSKPIS